jgi:hypothetical protein
MPGRSEFEYNFTSMGGECNSIAPLVRYACYDFRLGETFMRAFHICILLGFSLLVSCSSQGSAKRDPLTGTWVGDFGPAFYDRNTISLELHWDGQQLTGMIRPGVQGGRMYRNFAAFPIENSSFDPNSGVVKFEATFSARSRHYFVEGKLKKDTLSGTWNRPDENKAGDFKLTRNDAN